MPNDAKRWDVFISHASEDKESFVRPLAFSLKRLGAEVWYDEFSLQVGESLSRSIDLGLADSRFGLVIISPHFIGKAWPERELSGLVSREISQGRVILPVWHRVTREQVLAFSPPLADKVALRTDNLSGEDIAIQIIREIRPDLYDRHPRAALERLASGDALRDVQQELEAVKSDLAEFKCPFCGARLADRGGEFVRPNADHYGLHETFECGYHAFDGYTERPCPSDPNFPRFEDYEIQFDESPLETHFKWNCRAVPRTDMARKLSLGIAYGRTKQDAEQQIREHYSRYATNPTK